MLPEFPDFFEEIYQIRQNIQATDPHMIKEIEDLYDKHKKGLLATKKEDETATLVTPVDTTETTSVSSHRGKKPAQLTQPEEEKDINQPAPSVAKSQTKDKKA